ncbi:hypothetical protein QJS66_01285 [Kocuria rhizophila]|nr:hypothetical protein QJS66_01285 [Kocuria rhizophila]
MAHEYTCDHGAYPSCLEYLAPQVHLHVLSTRSSSRHPHDGARGRDIINLDATAYKNGMMGTPTPCSWRGRGRGLAAARQRTLEATNRAIKAVRPGRERST